MKKKHNVILALCLALSLLLPVNALAASQGVRAPDFKGYVAPAAEPKGQEAIRQDANHFIEKYYSNIPDLQGQEYFKSPYTDLKPTTGEIITRELRVDETYNVDDRYNGKSGEGGMYGPMLYYYKPGGGPERTAQYLGQTKQGYTITNVRFPLTASWDFLENLDWALAGGKEEESGKKAFNWWSQKQGNPLPEKFPFNEMAYSDSEYARVLDFCIGYPTIPQIRNWNGKQYFMSKAMAGKDGRPCLISGVQNFRPELTTTFPWHNYVNILVPPTYNTWGYGIGFYRYNGGWSYKSFPIAPLRTVFIPDFYPTPEGATQWTESFATCAKTYTGKSGETINIPVRLYNGGLKASKTDFQATWYGTGWKNPVWTAGGDVELQAGEYKEFTVPVVVPEAGKETKLVFTANLSKHNPELEINMENNMMIIKVQPEGVDLACSLKANQRSYTMQKGAVISPTVFLNYNRKDKGTEPVKAKLSWTTPNGTFSQPLMLKPGDSQGMPLSFSVSKPGTYVVKAEIWPIEATDVYPKDNTASCSIQVLEKSHADKGATDSGTRTGLGG